MNELIEKFSVFVRSAFADSERNRLFEWIWKNYGKRIYFYISTIIPLDHLYIDDIFQDIMIKIYTNLHNFNPIYPFKPWIYKITKNHCFNFLKNKKEKIYTSGEIDYNHVQDHRNPEKISVQDELCSEIERFMKSLETQDQEIFYLRFYENLRHKHISEIMAMNINTVRSRVRIIKLKLKENFRRTK